MLKKSLYVLIGIICLSCPSIYATEAFDPAACVKAIAPFIEEETFGVIHVDLERTNADVLSRQMIHRVPDVGQDVPKTKQRAEQLLRALANANVKDIYGMFSLAGFPNDMVFAVVPLSPEVDVEQLLNGPKKLDHGARVSTKQGDYLVIASPATQKRLKRIKPAARPELEKAFEAAGPVAFTATFIPPKHTRRTVEEIMPELPEKFSGGPSSVLTQGCLWASLSIDLGPKTVIQGTMQSSDAKAAKTLAAKWPKLIHAIIDQLPFAYNLPNIERLLDALTPRVENDKLIWSSKKEKQKD